jgi:hypothetical protein
VNLLIDTRIVPLWLADDPALTLVSVDRRFGDYDVALLAAG